MSRWRSIVIAAGLVCASALALEASAQEMKTAVFAAGCFWCVEEAFDKVPGVSETISGYTGGSVENPTYEQVSGGETGHFEAVEVKYDPAKVTYAQLLDTFWHNVDPFDAHGQFCDKGTQYLGAVFVGGDEERKAAEQSLASVSERFKQPVATQILPAQTFYPAEEYHQNFHETSTARYQYYKFGCGRVQRLEEIWGKPSA